MKPNTIIIYDQCGQEPLSFAWKEGHYLKFHECYLNSSDLDEKTQDELTAFIETCDFMPRFPLELVTSGTIVIVIGFFP